MAKNWLFLVILLTVWGPVGQAQTPPIDAETQIAFENLNKARAQINTLIEGVSNSQYIVFRLENTRTIRKNISQFVAKNPFPLNDGLELKAYEIKLVQASCDSDFVDNDGTKKNQYDVNYCKYYCWGAAAEMMKFTDRQGCEKDNAATSTEQKTQCYRNIFEDILEMTILQLQVDKQTSAQRAQVLAEDLARHKAETQPEKLPKSSRKHP